MAEIYQIPDAGANAGGIPFSIPLGGNNGGLFGNGGGSLVDLFGFAIIASMFGWGGNGFGGGFGGNGNGAGFISNQLNNDSGRELIMNAITSQGEAQRTAIQTLASTIGQDFNLVNSAVMNMQNSLNLIANNQNTNALQIINAIQAGNASIISQFQQCCCQQQLATERQTNTLQAGANANTQAILSKLSEMQTQSLQDKLDASRAENTRLAGEISQANQNSAIGMMIAQAVNPLTAQLAGIRSEVDAIKRCQPSTITLPNNSMTAVPSIWANAVADNIVDRIATALTPTTTTPAA
jgi:predicted O-linked N-acetylglucosamine transferase (SPINDLY family)